MNPQGIRTYARVLPSGMASDVLLSKPSYRVLRGFYRFYGRPIPLPFKDALLLEFEAEDVLSAAEHFEFEYLPVKMQEAEDTLQGAEHFEFEHIQASNQQSVDTLLAEEHFAYQLFQTHPESVEDTLQGAEHFAYQLFQTHPESVEDTLQGAEHFEFEYIEWVDPVAPDTMSVFISSGTANLSWPQVNPNPDNYEIGYRLFFDGSPTSWGTLTTSVAGSATSHQHNVCAIGPNGIDIQYRIRSLYEHVVSDWTESNITTITGC